MVERYDVNGSEFEIWNSKDGEYVAREDYAALQKKFEFKENLTAQIVELQQKLDAMAAENVALRISRGIMAENTLETCNAIASAGFRHEAIMRGLMASTGNGNKYPKPITTLVDEALREIETPATDAYLNSVRAEGVEVLATKITKSISDEGKPDSHHAYAYIAMNFADKLRSGTHDAAKDGE